VIPEAPSEAVESGMAPQRFPSRGLVYHKLTPIAQVVHFQSASHDWSSIGRLGLRSTALMTNIAIYGPPHSQAKTGDDVLVCANVSGLWWSQ
jgi:hypothetical protein